MAHSPQLFCRWTEGWSHTPCQGKHSMGEHLSKRQISQGKLHRALGLPGELFPSLIILAEKSGPTNYQDFLFQRFTQKIEGGIEQLQNFLFVIEMSCFWFQNSSQLTESSANSQENSHHFQQVPFSGKKSLWFQWRGINELRFKHPYFLFLPIITTLLSLRTKYIMLL